MCSMRLITQRKLPCIRPVGPGALVLITLLSILLPPQPALAVSGWTIQAADTTRAGQSTSIAPYNLNYTPYHETLGTVYVNATTGNDSYNGSSPVHTSGNIGPKKTISAAISVVSASGTVYVAAGTYNEDIGIADNLTIIGAGAHTTIISHYPVDRAESVVGISTGGQPVSLSISISGFTIQNGYIHGLAYGDGAGISVDGSCTAYLADCVIINNDALVNGGGIYNAGMLSMVDCTIANNQAGDGGGIYNEGMLYMDRCCVSGNFAAYNGGGVFNDGGLVWLTNCTISGNTVLETDFSAGGGINNISGTITLLNCTIAYNSVVPGLGKGGGFADQSGTTMTFKNTIVAYNTASQNNNGYFYPAGSVTSSGNNIDSEDSCGFNQHTDQINTNPRLRPLQDNGGPTKTHAILASSPAYNRGTSVGAPSDDQRGVRRPQAGFYDIGSFELVAAAPSPQPSPRGSSLLNEGQDPGSSGMTAASLVPPPPPIVNPSIIILNASLSSSQNPRGPVTVNTTVANTSTVNGITKVRIYVNGQVDAEQSVNVASGEQKLISFTLTRSEPGTYYVHVNNVSAGSFVVTDAVDPDTILFVSAGLFVLSVLGLAIFFIRRQHQN